MNTTTPWKQSEFKHLILKVGDCETIVANCYVADTKLSQAEQEANAAHIVKCVNFFEELLQFVGNSKCTCTSQLNNDCPACELFARAKSGTGAKMSLQKSINLLQPKTVVMEF